MLFTEYNFFKVNFIDPASPLMYGIIELHDHIFFFLNMILFLVLFLLVTTLKYFSYDTNSKLNRYLLLQTASPRFDWLRLSHGTTIEIVWTVLPSIILILIAIPSFALLYATDELVDPSVTVQVIGHQWYWSYEYNDLTLPVLSDSNNTSGQQTDGHLRTFSGLLGYPRRQMFSYSGYLFDGLDLGATELGLSSATLSTYLRADVAENGINYNSPLPLKTLYTSRLGYWSAPLKAVLRDIEWGKVMGFIPTREFLVGNLEFDSYMRQESDLALGEHRLYETDFPLVLPKFTHIRFMITSDDVIHSWSVPALGIKVDAVPGRINHAHTYIKRSGVFYGQCSELCGVNHAFMPIQILAFEPRMYYNYIQLMLLNK